MKRLSHVFFCVAGLVIAASAPAPAATLDVSAIPPLPLLFTDGLGNSATANIERLDSTDSQLDDVFQTLESELSGLYEIARISPIDGQIIVNEFAISDYGINASVQTRVLGLEWNIVGQGDIGDFGQFIFMVSLLTSQSNFLINDTSNANPTYPFTGGNGNFGWVIQGPDTMVDTRYLMFARQVLDENEEPILGESGFPLIEVADVVVMSLQAELVPEPGSLALLACGVGVLGLARRR